MSLADNQNQELVDVWLTVIVGALLVDKASPCVWDPPSALCIGTVCLLICRSTGPFYHSVPATTATTKVYNDSLNTQPFGGNFELPNYFTSPDILFFSPNFAFPVSSWFPCLSTIAYLHFIGYLRLIQLSCEINSLNRCLGLKHKKSLL
ncbi:hypothetical protein N7447_010062 [Penicillium robsamsonii]|uniref:uncharacterized protein n=1 Tax=Penicillium robsamsonii TaxID=1792511 RepID=UPI0025468C5C|nr:uncharacterized protein N7447_010062 [Penicillium robsamsonii]KAJ5813039.1 hypothetical protein N7447_010062 [Penicillium robsamsonii]